MKQDEAIPSGPVVLVDPLSTGALIAVDLDRKGYKVIALWTKGCYSRDISSMATGFPAAFLAQVEEQDTLRLTTEALRKVASSDVSAVICGFETGVDLANALSEYMGLRGNTTSGGMANRRSKQVQQDAVKARGLRAARSVSGKTWEDVEGFVETEVLPMIVKPLKSGGSDGVKLCFTRAEVQEHFQLLMESQRPMGAHGGAAVLLQEYLRGTEYAVDHVSRDGVHKTTMVWVYQKGPANGAGFVPFGEECMPECPERQELIAYTRSCLDALHITNGPTHTEVMMTETGPCLVEINSRCHGAGGACMPLAQATVGYTQVDASVSAFLSAEAFGRLPDVPPSFEASGQMVVLISYLQGLVAQTRFELVKELQSCVSLDPHIHAGDYVKQTIDCGTYIGICVLVHSDPAVLACDLNSIRQMERAGSLFVLAK